MIWTTYQRVVSGEAGIVSELINKTFDKYIKPSTSSVGLQAFRCFSNENAIDQRVKTGDSFALTAKIRQSRNDKNPQIIGVIEVRDHSHLNMLFVDEQYQGKGIAKQLFEIALEMCKQNKKGITQLTVAATPNSVEIFEKLGFQISKGYNNENKHVNGLDFIPMEYPLQIQRCRS